ncbi:hypothetical protein MMC25_000516 [Agyrium rufum]|nr:hypothetical protein [Agyrium rufum]
MKLQKKNTSIACVESAGQNAIKSSNDGAEKKSMTGILKKLCHSASKKILSLKGNLNKVPIEIERVDIAPLAIEHDAPVEETTTNIEAVTVETPVESPVITTTSIVTPETVSTVEIGVPTAEETLLHGDQNATSTTSHNRNISNASTCVSNTSVKLSRSASASTRRLTRRLSIGPVIRHIPSMPTMKVVPHHPSPPRSPIDEDFEVQKHRLIQLASDKVEREYEVLLSSHQLSHQNELEDLKEEYADKIRYVEAERDAAKSAFESSQAQKRLITRNLRDANRINDNLRISNTELETNLRSRAEEVESLFDERVQLKTDLLESKQRMQVLQTANAYHIDDKQQMERNFERCLQSWKVAHDEKREENTELRRELEPAREFIKFFHVANNDEDRSTVDDDLTITLDCDNCNRMVRAVVTLKKGNLVLIDALQEARSAWHEANEKLGCIGYEHELDGTDDDFSPTELAQRRKEQVEALVAEKDELNVKLIDAEEAAEKAEESKKASVKAAEDKLALANTRVDNLKTEAVKANAFKEINTLLLLRIMKGGGSWETGLVRQLTNQIFTMQTEMAEIKHQRDHAEGLYSLAVDKTVDTQLQIRTLKEELRDTSDSLTATSTREREATRLRDEYEWQLDFVRDEVKSTKEKADEEIKSAEDRLDEMTKLLEGLQSSLPTACSARAHAILAMRNGYIQTLEDEAGKKSEQIDELRSQMHRLRSHQGRIEFVDAVVQARNAGINRMIESDRQWAKLLMDCVVKEFGMEKAEELRGRVAALIPTTMEAFAGEAVAHDAADAEDGEMF